MNTKYERALRCLAGPSKGHALKRNRRSVVAPYELGEQLTISRHAQNHLGCGYASAELRFTAFCKQV